MLENYLPSKKILYFFALAIIIIGISWVLGQENIKPLKGGGLHAVEGSTSVVEDIDRALNDNVNKTTVSFEKIAESALLVTLGKQSSQVPNGIAPDEEAIEEFVSTVVQSINYKVAEYTTEDLSLRSNSKKNYQNYISSILEESLRFAESMDSDELSILAQAIQTENENLLEELNPIIEKYKTFQKNLLEIPVIRDLEEEHLEIINNYSKIILSVGDMRKFFVDPVSTLIGVQTYKELTTRNDELFFEIGNYIINY